MEMQALIMVGEEITSWQVEAFAEVKSLENIHQLRKTHPQISEEAVLFPQLLGKRCFFHWRSGQVSMKSIWTMFCPTEEISLNHISHETCLTSRNNDDIDDLPALDRDDDNEVHGEGGLITE